MDGLGLAPPTKSRHQAGFREAAEEPSRGRHAPVKDDSIVGGQDEFGMVPEIVVGLKGELEDLNVDPISMDRDSDSPHPPFPTKATVLDSTVQAEVVLDTISAVLREMPLMQPRTSLPRKEPSPRVVLHKLPK